MSYSKARWTAPYSLHTKDFFGSSSDLTYQKWSCQGLFLCQDFLWISMSSRHRHRRRSSAHRNWVYLRLSFSLAIVEMPLKSLNFELRNPSCQIGYPLTSHFSQGWLKNLVRDLGLLKRYLVLVALAWIDLSCLLLELVSWGCWILADLPVQNQCFPGFRLQDRGMHSWMHLKLDAIEFFTYLDLTHAVQRSALSSLMRCWLHPLDESGHLCCLPRWYYSTPSY